VHSDKKLDELWLEYDKQPLHWNVPAGPQFDCFTKNMHVLPWPLKMHYSKFPEDLTAPLVTLDYKRFIVMNLLKEMTYLRFGDSLRILRDLSPDDNKSLIESIQKCMNIM